MANPVLLTISIVSHAQGGLVRLLLDDIEKFCNTPLEVILTLNIPESFQPDISAYGFPIKVIENFEPKGFGRNHNAAFALAQGEFFCVANPDIRLTGDPFPILKKCLLEQNVGVAAPLVLSAKGEIEDSARKFPTPFSLLDKALGVRIRMDYLIDGQPFYPDWVGGMFMLFRGDVFKEMGGFDTGYFLYYEDVDLCARLTLRDYRVAVCPEVSVIHEARRTSHTNLRYFRRHVSSALRFFLSPVYRQLQNRK